MGIIRSFFEHNKKQTYINILVMLQKSSQPTTQPRFGESSEPFCKEFHIILDLWISTGPTPSQCHHLPPRNQAAFGDSQGTMMEPSSFMTGLLSWGRNVAERGDSHDFHNGGGCRSGLEVQPKFLIGCWKRTTHLFIDFDSKVYDHPKRNHRFFWNWWQRLPGFVA